MKSNWILVSVWFTLRILIHRLSLWGHVEEDIRTTPIGSSCTHLIHAITCLWGGFFYAGFEKPLEGRIESKEHVNMGSITIGHARKLLPMTFLNCHAFGEAVFRGEVSRRRIFLLREHRHHTEKENNYGSKDFWGWERRGMINIWEFIINIKSHSLGFF